jgi:hypothetical protein
MAYSSEIADVLTAQLDRLSKLNPHQLAGQVANLDFWLSEVSHCQDVIDGYRSRFERMKAAQKKFVREQKTTVVYPEVAMAPTTPVGPVRVPDEELKLSGLHLREAFYRFLIRAYRERLIDEPLLRKTADVIDLGIDLVDLRR